MTTQSGLGSVYVSAVSFSSSRVLIVEAVVPVYQSGGTFGIENNSPLDVISNQ